MKKIISTIIFSAGCLLTLPSCAVDLGPFQLTGFTKLETVRVNNLCPNCQLLPNEDKQRLWADFIPPGREYGPRWTHVTLIQPYLGAKFDLAKGFKISGLVSQRWRDGMEDIPGFMYEQNIALSHEKYGSVRYGAMTTRTWSLADYPYGTNLNVADAWGSSGAGYGLLQNALRYISPTFDVLDGDLVVEASYDRGNTDFKIHKSRFLETYAKYVKGDLVLDFVAQDTRNGQAQSWSHGPFIGLTPNSADDALLSETSQSITMLMGKYQYTNQLEFSGGVRRNRWSGAAAVITSNSNGVDRWNNMFNVDWNAAGNPGYPAQSTDYLLGARYQIKDWTASVGMVYLGTADTSNPSERGQSNDALIQTAGINYVVGHGVSVYGHVGMVHYKKLGLSPMSMPSNSAFTQVDSRVTQNGNWGGVGLVYVF